MRNQPIKKEKLQSFPDRITSPSAVPFLRSFLMVTITVNGVKREIQSPSDTPLLYVLRNDLNLSGPQFGCGLMQCGACSVLLEGKEIRSCATPVSAAAGKAVTTLEGLPARWAQQKGLSAADAAKTLHPVQQAWI